MPIPRHAKPHYRADIDGLRAIAVLSVMLYHLNNAWLPGGFAGVDVFFVISGFVVTASLASNGGLPFHQFIASFYARRLARIVPALVVTLLASALAATLFIPHAWLSGLSDETARYAFFGLSNWILQHNTDIYFSPRAEFNPYTHTWSLGIEEQFYVIVPILLFFWTWRQTRARGSHHKYVIGALAMVCAISLGICIWVSKTDPAMAFYFIGARFWELGLGALLFLLTQKCKPPEHSHIISAIYFGPFVGIAGLAVALVFSNPSAFPWPWALLATSAAVLMIGGNHALTENPVRRILASPILVWVGLRSFSLYLWHWPVYVVIRWTVGLESFASYAAALGLTFFLSTACYRWIERPFRHNQLIKTRSNPLRILFFIALICAGLLTVNFLFSHPHQLSLSKVSRHPADWYRSDLHIYPELNQTPCQSQVSITDFSGGKIVRAIPVNCQGIELSGQAVYVLGDSHADMLVPTFKQLSAEQGKRVEIFVFPGCSYINFRAPMSGQFSQECINFNRQARDQIAADAKPQDMVVLPSLRMERYGDQWASFHIPDMHEKMHGQEATKERQAALVDARQWLDPLTRKQISVLFMAPPPIFQAPTFRCADWFNQRNPICIGSNQQSRAELERLRGPIVSAMQTLAQSQPLIQVWDPFPTLCPGQTCSTFKDARPLFFDGDHLSNYGNLVIYPELNQWVRKIQSSPTK